MAENATSTPTSLPVSPQPPLVIPHVLTEAELAGLLRIGEALADIQACLAAIMGQPRGPLAADLANLATVTLDLLDVVAGDPDLEPAGDEEPSLGWSATGATGTLDASPFLADLEEEHDGREPDADDGDPWYVPARLDMLTEQRPTSPAFVSTLSIVRSLAND